MLRAQFIALLALLAGAAFACSDSVPPPGATLSGLVYHDANANGIRDSCDRGTVGQLAEVPLLPLNNDGVALEGFTRFRQGGAYTIKVAPTVDSVLHLNSQQVAPYWLNI